MFHHKKTSRKCRSYPVRGVIQRHHILRLLAHQARTGRVDGEVDRIDDVPDRGREQLDDQIALLLLVLGVGRLKRANAVQVDLDLRADFRVVSELMLIGLRSLTSGKPSTFISPLSAKKLIIRLMRVFNRDTVAL